MGQAKRRGTFEERKAQAIEDGRRQPEFQGSKVNIRKYLAALLLSLPKGGK